MLYFYCYLGASSPLLYLEDGDEFVLLLVPAAIYTNADLQPFELRARMFGARCMHACRNIREETNYERKQGESKIYIGSSVDLAGRFQSYLSTPQLKRTVLNGRSIICNTLLKNGRACMQPAPKSEEHKLKFSLANPNRIKIEVTDLELDTKTTYNSKAAAARALNISQTSIN
jgi:hypothetical protein